ncbi:UDP-N-acetylmuramate dehydrogenase [Paenibacillus mendelii]|uniref:UDP-N-acetylenolpyruvoylglucosamine reductase n=1 Tax=Paenibacillus mendelii TaxID=206163 RepID=A0ABV6JJ53_9BACL|nr:UDP-N-acetylmuramate dehydrogenase [Paenibacillus mendelii]MCQ6558875.1 UDP-N-acetylmuramate dehydrogenase [Paenibacillus mendelii]
MFQQLACRVEENFSIKSITTMAVGGACKYYIIPQSIEDLQTVTRISRDRGMKLLIIGNGSNIIVDDDGFDGIVLHIGKRLGEMRLEQNYLYAEAGVSLPKIALKMASEGKKGFEFMVSIPGTVGGAVIMNAGSAGREMSDVLHSVTYLDEEGNLLTKSAEECGLSFRSSGFTGTNAIILSAQFHVEYAEDRSELMLATKKIATVRKSKFPMNVKTVGSTFKSPASGPHPGKCIEAVGLKGYRIGNVEISPVHGNWIINLGNATSRDVKSIISLMKDTVAERLGIDMEQEVIYV